MKNQFSKDDAKQLHAVMVNSIRSFADNGSMNYILLSGGIDSLCVLYAIMETELPYKVINFKFSNRDSIDTNSVKKLHKKIGFDVDWLNLEEENDDDLQKSVDICMKIFGRIRKVKVETIYAMLQVRKHIPKGVNILSGFGGDGACCYHKNDALLISKVGEEHPDVIAIRRGDKSKDEFRYVFHDYRYYTPFHEKEVTDVIVQYTSKACNAGFPKSALVFAFEEMFKKYKNARKPIGFHKASCEVQMFEDIAIKRGYKSALQMFNAMSKQ